MAKHPCVYIMANKPYGTLYTGVTSNILERAYQHRAKLQEGFTNRYKIGRLVYYELHPDMESAIAREKQIKKLYRVQKIALIKKQNPRWRDLFYKLTGQG